MLDARRCSKGRRLGAGRHRLGRVGEDDQSRTGRSTYLTSCGPKKRVPFWRQIAVDPSSNVVLAAIGQKICYPT